MRRRPNQASDNVPSNPLLGVIFPMIGGLAGGFTRNFLGCLYLNLTKRSWSDRW
jgi:hypothetical protein